MILVDRQIREYVDSGDIEITPFEDSQVQAATYDFRVGEYGITTSSKKKVNIRENGYLLLDPGDFGVVTVLEVLKLGAQYTGRFGLRSKYARKGLVATTGPQIDPGYYGRLIIGVTNLTPKPVSLPYKDDLISVEFHRLEEPAANPYKGPYQSRLELGAEEMEFISESEGMGLSEMLNTLRSLTANVAEMDKSISALASQFKILLWAVPIGMAVLALIVAVT